MESDAGGAGVGGREPGPAVGLVLAAGEGRRLGLGAKALLTRGGVSLVAQAVGALRAGGCEAVLVVVGAQAGEVAAEVVAAGGEVVLNPDWASGLASSFRRGVAALPGDAARVVVSLVDQPGVGAEVVQRVLAGHRPGRIAAAEYARVGAAPADEGSSSGTAPSALSAPTPPRARHPMVFDAQRAREAAALAEGDRGAREFLRRHPDLLDLVDCAAIGSAADVDTPEDLHLLEP